MAAMGELGLRARTLNPSGWRSIRSPGDIHTRRPSTVSGGLSRGQNPATQIEGERPLPGHVVGEELAVDVRFANTARDELGGLGSEVEDRDCVHRSLVPSPMDRA